MLLPALNKAREHAKLSTCTGNLKQVSLYLQSYLNDWDNYYPNWISWESDLDFYRYPNIKARYDAYAADKNIICAALSASCRIRTMRHSADSASAGSCTAQTI